MHGEVFATRHSSAKYPILVSKGLYNLFHKQNNTWLLVDIEFLFFSFVQRDISLFHCVHSEDIELNTRREIPHQRTPM